MTTWKVTHRETGQEVTRYAAQQPVEQIDDLAVPFADYDHTEPPDEIDTLVNAELAQWQPMLAPMVAPLQAALSASVDQDETATEFVERLPALLAKMDADALAQALTRSAFTARLGALAGLADEPGASAAFAEVAAVAEPAPTLLQATPDPRIDQLLVSMATMQSSVDLLQAKEPLVIQNTIQLPEQPAPVVNNTVNLPEQAPTVVNLPETVVNLASPAITVQPADVVINNTHPTRAVQTVERDANDEIVRTVTTYQTHQE